MEAAYVIQNAFSSFPIGSIHVIGVDSELNPENSHIAMVLNGHYFVCANNGILSMICNDITPMDLDIKVSGDLEVDEHHTIEDTAIALGTLFNKTLGNKLGIERYGFCLPMDDCLAQVAIDFGGRNWLVWEAEFKREYIGKMPTEMFMHFFKSFTDGAKCNLNIQANGTNEHHKIEAIFKAFAKSIKMAVKRDVHKMILPSTKGML